MKSALFVDFDNVYSGLRKLDPAVAERFGRHPLEWIGWLTDGLGLPEGLDAAEARTRRRLLVRRVYLNPQVYQRFRPSFNHAGFEIVDCPSMTSEGKTSTDIHMVLDMVELLQHPVHYDEFIVFSADADFTPVLRKLRRWDRHDRLRPTRSERSTQSPGFRPGNAATMCSMLGPSGPGDTAMTSNRRRWNRGSARYFLCQRR